MKRKTGIACCICLGIATGAWAWVVPGSTSGLGHLGSGTCNAETTNAWCVAAPVRSSAGRGVGGLTNTGSVRRGDDPALARLALPLVQRDGVHYTPNTTAV